MKVTDILSRLDGVRKSGSGWTARCPAHEDQRSSLSVNTGDDGRILLHCHATCTVEAVVEKLGLTMRDLMSSNGSGRHGGNSKPEIGTAHSYRNEDDELLFQVCRMIPKDFRQRKPAAGGGWSWSTKDVRKVLYRLPELLAADPAEPVFIPEGEKDVDWLAGLGRIATTSSGGAGKWRPEYNESLRGRHVVLLPDNDPPGRKHADQVARALQGVAESVKVLALPGLPDKGDVSDWLDGGGTVEELIKIVGAAPLWTPSSPEIEAVREEIEGVPLPAAIPWPVLAEDAYQGLAGEIVRTIEPETESDPAAILIQLLVSFGNLVGRGPHYLIEGTKHHANLFGVLVGSTARGRKGTSEGRVREILRSVDKEWTFNNIKTGLVSGEGIVWNVRDEMRGLNKKGEEVLLDEGISDKRLLIIESEFASVLRVCRRETNTLSPTLRSAWDSGHLRTMAKNSPAKSTGAHISVVGHITREELRRALCEIDGFNGFSNRFLWVAVRRSKLLPDGGADLDLDGYAERLALAVEQARSVDRMQRDQGAAALWRTIYAELADDDSTGLLAAVTSRAEAQVLRISLIYALLDGGATIREEHLLAAVAVWEYCRHSARLIFGDAGGDPLEDKVLETIRRHPAGISRWELHSSTCKHKKAAVLVEVLTRLRDAGKIESKTVTTTGRSAETWFAIKNTSERPEVREGREVSPSISRATRQPDGGLTSHISLTSQGSGGFEEIKI